MFKPFYGICVCHKLKRLIVVKKGYCKIGNDENNNKNKSSQNGSKRKNTFPSRFKSSSGSGDECRHEGLRKLSKIPRRLPIRKGLKKGTKRKPTGELELFKKIYEERGPYSQVAPYEYVKFDIRCFSHLLSKQSYPSLRLEPENIVIKTPKQHDMWHNQYHKLKGLPEWQWVLEKEQALKRKYYEENRIKKL